MFHKCPFGEKCIDTGVPSDCEVNSRCINFSSEQEKLDFDNLPDRYVVRTGNLELRLKNSTQVKFFLKDYSGQVSVAQIRHDGEEIPLNLIDLIKSC